MRQSLLVVLVGMTSACSAEPTETDPVVPVILDPCVEASQRRVEFQLRDLRDATAMDETVEVQIRNLCEGVLELGATSLSGQTPEAFSVVPLSDPLLGEGEQTTLSVTFAPQRWGDKRATVVLETNDPEVPQLLLRLQGLANGPELAVQPSTIAMNTTRIGCPGVQPIQLSNLGNVELEVTSITLETSAAEELSLDLRGVDNGQLPFILGPRQSTTADVHLDHLPTDAVPDDLTVRVQCDDPARPELVLKGTAVGASTRRLTQRFEVEDESKIDVLFTFDRSGTPTDEALALMGEFESFMQVFRDESIDVHVAAAVTDDGCVLGPEPYIDLSFSASYADSAILTMADMDMKLSSYGSNTERGFMLAEAALSNKNVGSRGCNRRFYREDATLALIHHSDEPEQSREAWTHYVSEFRALKADPGDVVINALAGDWPAGCASAAPGDGYYQAVVETGGAFVSICTEDWRGAAETLARGSLVRRHSYILAEAPVIPTLEVRVDGELRTEGWTYDPKLQAIVFAAETAPRPASILDVAFEAAPSPDECG